jgi:hypothetical protein
MEDVEGMSLDQAIMSANQPQPGQQVGGTPPPINQPGNGQPQQGDVAEAALPVRTQRVLAALRETAEAIASASNVSRNGNGAHPR